MFSVSIPNSFISCLSLETYETRLKSKGMRDSERTYFLWTAVVLGLLAFCVLDGEGTKSPPTPSQLPPTPSDRTPVKRCDGITSTINVPFLEKQYIGDVLITWSVLSKLQCEDLCMRNPICKGFNYKNHQCEILSEIYSEVDKEMSRGTRAFMKTYLLGKGECMD